MNQNLFEAFDLPEDAFIKHLKTNLFVILMNTMVKAGVPTEAQAWKNILGPDSRIDQLVTGDLFEYTVEDLWRLLHRQGWGVVYCNSPYRIEFVQKTGDQR